MFKILVPAVAALCLAAFAARTHAVTVDQPVAVRTAVAEQPAMGWHVSHEGTMAKLAYGVENSDQLAMMLACAPGDRSAVVYGDVLPASPRLAQATLNGDNGDARVAVGDATLRTLARNGVMPVVGAAGPTRILATAGEQRLIRGFLTYCEGATT